MQIKHLRIVQPSKKSHSSHPSWSLTAMNDLAQLQARGLLRRSKVGKAHVFSPIPDLMKALERAGRNA